MTDDDFLESESLDAHEWRGLQSLTNASSNFEPLAARANIGSVVAERLVERGLAEKGPCSTAYRNRGHDIGYRVSDLGWKVVARGRTPSRRRP